MRNISSAVISLATLVLLATRVEAQGNSSAFTSLALPGEHFTLIDFRPLRPYAHQGMIAELSDVWKSLFFRADAALVIRGGGTGSYNITGGNQ